MSSKIVEAGAGVHSLAMAVAVSIFSQRQMLNADHIIIAGHKLAFVWCERNGYNVLSLTIIPDSIYTERYMNLPDANPGGYINASISNVTAFHGVDYLLAHGSGDDNVHYANSAHLLDMLTRERVRGFRFRMFTDRHVHAHSRWPNLLNFCTQ